MSDVYSLASTRRSIRKFTGADVPMDDILACIRTAVTAPSGCGSQCWYFAVVRNRDVLGRMAEAVAESETQMLDSLALNDGEEYLRGRIRGATFFADAPVCIAVFMTRMDYYDKKVMAAWLKKGRTREEFMLAKGQPDLLSLGAAVQTLLLALHEKGYGACWMNDPVSAGPAINKILGVPADYPLVCLVPVGFPAYTPKEKMYKPMEEILKIVD